MDRPQCFCEKKNARLCFCVTDMFPNAFRDFVKVVLAKSLFL